MANIADYKGNVAVYNNDREVVRIKYDFAKDGGAVGALNLFVAKQKMIVLSAYMVAKAAVTTAGAAGTLSVGKSADVAGIIAATGDADLEINEVKFGASLDASHVLAVDDVLVLDIATAAVTAGEVDIVLELRAA